MRSPKSRIKNHLVQESSVQNLSTRDRWKTEIKRDSVRFV